MILLDFKTMGLHSTNGDLKDSFPLLAPTTIVDNRCVSSGVNMGHLFFVKII
jgi:hypothetical protein